MALFGMFVIGVSKYFSVSKKSDVSTVIMHVNVHVQFLLAGPGFKHSISLYWFPCPWREADGDIWCLAVRKYFSSPDITALQRASGSVCPFYNQGWGYFPHSARVLQRRVYLRLTAIVIQKVDIKLCWVTEALFLKWYDKAFSFTAELEDLENLSVTPDER